MQIFDKNLVEQTLKENLKYPESKNLQQRGIADKIEERCTEILKENFEDVNDPTSRRSIEDVSIGNTLIDTKTSDEALTFKMPNMISIDRLRSVIKDNKQLFYNFVIYNSESNQIIDNFVLNVFELNWEYLSIQNLGKGQLQITDMKKFLQDPKSKQTKQQWIETLKQNAITFHKNVEIKAQKRQKEWGNWFAQIG
tara:strand:+ start:39 stop:626 length:588 start_codon:yes stop_codon:yes gene_type:complete